MVGDPFNPADRPPIFNEANGEKGTDTQTNHVYK
jgi:hypothetical protein